MNWWKIECLDCGVNCDLLKDSLHRIICRECLAKNEFKEVENEIYESEMEPVGADVTIGNLYREFTERMSKIVIEPHKES